jgi:hypothetical protein
MAGTLDLLAAIVLATIYGAAAFTGPAYWIPAFWVLALLVTHYVTFLLLRKRWAGTARPRRGPKLIGVPKFRIRTSAGPYGCFLPTLASLMTEGAPELVRESYPAIR